MQTHRQVCDPLPAVRLGARLPRVPANAAVTRVSSTWPDSPALNSSVGATRSRSPRPVTACVVPGALGRRRAVQSLWTQLRLAVQTLFYCFRQRCQRPSRHCACPPGSPGSSGRLTAGGPRGGQAEAACCLLDPCCPLFPPDPEPTCCSHHVSQPPLQPRVTTQLSLLPTSPPRKQTLRRRLGLGGLLGPSAPALARRPPRVSSCGENNALTDCRRRRGDFPNTPDDPPLRERSRSSSSSATSWVTRNPCDILHVARRALCDCCRGPGVAWLGGML